jgi:hypothetical protein
MVFDGEADGSSFALSPSFLRDIANSAAFDALSFNDSA